LYAYLHNEIILKKKKEGTTPPLNKPKKPKNRYDWFRSDVNLVIIKLIE
jgi:hypothetical protein